MKPLINLDELEFEACGEDPYTQRYSVISDHIGARKLGYNLTVVPPGARACAFHAHHANEELFVILEGTGLLRFGDAEHPLRANDVIACPPGGREVAHQIINSGDVDLKYLAISTKERIEVAEFPDSGCVRVLVGDYGAMDFRGDYEAAATIDLDARERAKLR